MKGGWFKACDSGRRFILKISQGEDIHERLKTFASEAGVKNGIIISAVGSVFDVEYRGIKSGAKLPLTPARTSTHMAEGPLELLSLSGNIFPDENNQTDVHMHVTVSKSSGEVLGGHLYSAKVFASCEIQISEIIVTGVERHVSKSGGTQTIFIEDENE